jgi:type IV pilus assembly protein PilC
MAQAAVKSVMFVWEGRDKQGKKVKGEMSGTSDALVKAMLRRQGINPMRVKKKPMPLFGGGGKKIKPKDIAIFSRQLATMMSSGVPLVQSFEIVGKGHENPNMQKLILDVKAHVEAGNNLADALAKHPLYFDDLYVALVRAGEAAGILETLLDKIATYKEKIFVIPQFASLFSDFGADLPAMTLFVISMSNYFVKYWVFIFGGVGGGIWGFLELKKRNKNLRHALERLSLKIPVIGDILIKATIARFARTLATMFAAGVPLVEAMDSVAGAAGNVVYGQAILRMRDEIATGTQLQASMRDTHLFPNMVVQMVAIGEESGSIDHMLGKVADFYEEEVDNAVDAMSSLMEPMIMAVLGVLIGGLVIAMYLPIFKMGEVV